MKGKVVRREEGLTEVLDIVLGLLIQKNATILWHFLYNLYRNGHVDRRVQ